MKDVGLIIASETGHHFKDSALNVNKAHQTLNNKPLKIKHALKKMKQEVDNRKCEGIVVVGERDGND